MVILVLGKMSSMHECLVTFFHDSYMVLYDNKKKIISFVVRELLFAPIHCYIHFQIGLNLNLSWMGMQEPKCVSPQEFSP
jgi:hypothetical protein